MPSSPGARWAASNKFTFTRHSCIRILPPLIIIMHQHVYGTTKWRTIALLLCTDVLLFVCQCVYVSAANNLYTIMMCAVHAIHIVVIVNNEWFIVTTVFRDSSIRICIYCSIIWSTRQIIIHLLQTRKYSVIVVSIDHTMMNIVLYKGKYQLD